MKYHKLIRDKIPQILEDKGVKYTTHVAKDLEYWESLVKKLQEEVDEFKDENNTEELADILEVIQAICEYKNFSLDELEKERQVKKEKRGGFTKRIILEETED